MSEKELVAAKLIWALLEDLRASRAEESRKMTGTVKEALEAATKLYFEE
jgi:hypothetical protein